MQHKLLRESDGQRTFAIVLDTGDMAGHLGEAHVRPTLEVILVESPAHLRKAKDPATDLALIHPQAVQ